MAAIVKAIRALLFEPFVTGPLLYLLLKGPTSAQQTVLDVLARANIPGDANVNFDRTIKALKVLFALGATSRVTRILNRLAVNKWSFSSKGVPYNWSNGQEIILITGGCSGFGLLMAKSFSGKGKIVVIDVSDKHKDLESIPNLHYYKCDLCVPEQIKSTAAKIKSEVGNPSVLVNNAGIAKENTIIGSTPEWIEKIFRVNLISHWQMVDEFLPAMLKARKGHIVEMASMASFLGLPTMTDYCAVKAGVLAFYEGLTAELQHVYENGECIRTSVIHPTWASTGIIAGYEHRLKQARQQVLDPKIVADAAVNQILNARSGQLIIPENAKIMSTMRSWPTWLQFMARGVAAKAGGRTSSMK